MSTRMCAASALAVPPAESSDLRFFEHSHGGAAAERSERAGHGPDRCSRKGRVGGARISGLTGVGRVQSPASRRALLVAEPEDLVAALALLQPSVRRVPKQDQ